MMKDGEENTPQTIEFKGGDDENSVEIVSPIVKVISSPGGHNHGSSKVKLKNIVVFSWEHRYYIGQLLAVHMSGKYLAYGLKAGNGNGVVRIVHKELEHRLLIKDMQGIIQDLAFAHVSSAILACVDHTGSLYVYAIESVGKELKYNKILQVDADDPSPLGHRVIWCPYIPDEEGVEAEDVSKLLLLTRGSKTELWSVAAASRYFPDPVKANSSFVKNSGCMIDILEHSGTIIEATFSPDGTALATASVDGEVKFFNVYLHQGTIVQRSPKCLHQWRPHDGRPVSSLFFLDDHKNFQPDATFWRFAITGCDNNTELKVWSCEYWICLQTITFEPNPSTQKLPVLKAQLDLASGYLLLSDIFNKVLYILTVTKDSEESSARITTISEFLVPSPILSFAIVDAGQRRLQPSSESLEDLCHCDENEDLLVIRMYLVQPRSLQECHIAFKPVAITSNGFLNATTHDSLDYGDDDVPEIHEVNGICDTETNIIEEGDNDNDNDSSSREADLREVLEIMDNHTSGLNGLNLMTPDEFSSPAKKEIIESDSASPPIGNIETCPSIAQTVPVLNPVDKILAINKIEEKAPASGGSSPSREVREILSLADPEETESEIKTENIGANNESWPDIPIGLIKDAMQSLHLELDNKDSVPEEVQKIVKDETANVIASTRMLESKLVSNMETITSKIDSVLEIVQDQQQEISGLRVELTRLRQETPFLNQIESTLAKSSQQHNANIEQILLNQRTVQNEFLKSLENKVKEKVEVTIPAVIHEIVDPLRNQLRLDVSVLNNTVKDNMIRVLSTSQVLDALTLAVVNAGKSAFDTAFKQAFSTILLPGMEKACQNMFKQVQDTFVRGTRDYISNVDSITSKHYQQLNEQQSETLISNVREQMQAEFTRGLSALQESTLKTMRDCLRENFAQHLSDISGARSRATTPGIPGPSAAESQARVLSLLQRGQLNAAFQQALSASDLNLVVLVCENTDPTRVFSVAGLHGSRCALQQPVLLSLVQQLSANLGHRTELKHRWLEEAVISLDPNDPVTQEHMVNVLIGLQNQIASFIGANQNHRSVRKLKMVAMAAQSLLKPM